MTEDEARAEVREFMAAQTPSERIRLIELFRQQMGLPPIEYLTATACNNGGKRRNLPGVMRATA